MRTPGVRVVIAALVMAVVSVGLVGMPAAHAETDIDVVAGYGADQFVPGRAVPVRVRISADRLVAGDLRVTAEGLGEAVMPIEVPVEVPGGSTKDVVVVIPRAPVGDRLEVTASLDAGEASARHETQLTFAGDTELVGVLPGLVEQLPQQVALGMDLGTARFAEVDAELPVPGALDILGTIVAGPEGLGDLEDAARRNVLDWLDRGGRLVVDTEPGSRIGGLPTEWQPGEAERRPAGRGEVRFSGGAASEGRWDEVVEPTSLALPGELMSSTMFASGDIATGVARDGGFRIPSLGWLLGFLVVYVALAGPVVFFVVRRRGVLWTWATLPALAVVFAAVAFVAGNDARSGSQSAHGTAVETSPAGARASTFLGLVSRTGADGEASFPAGWSVAQGPGLMDSMGQIAPMPAPGGGALPGLGGGGSGGGGVTVEPDGTTGEVELDPGDFALLRASGPLDDTSGLEVSATAAADGSLRGTVRNTTEVTLREVLVLIGDRVWDGDGDPLEPGEEVEWQLGPDEGHAELDFPPEAPWGAAIGWDGPVDSDNPVNYELWTELQGQLADPYAPGWVTAAGWTRDWTPPIDPGGDLEAGRTVFTTRAPVAAEDGAVPEDAVRREVLRGAQVTQLTEDREGVGDTRRDGAFAVDDWSVSGAVVRFTLPESADPSRSLEAELPGAVARAQVWDGSRWVSLQEPPGRPEVVDDPYDPALDRSIRLPQGAVQDGAVYLRVELFDSVLQPGMDFTVGEVAS